MKIIRRDETIAPALSKKKLLPEWFYWTYCADCKEFTKEILPITFVQMNLRMKSHYHVVIAEMYKLNNIIGKNITLPVVTIVI